MNTRTLGTSGLRVSAIGLGTNQFGGKVDQETRLYDPTAGETRSMRSKEEAMDYRYFPDPDLLPLELEQAWIDSIKASLPELPDQKRRRLMADYGLSQYDAVVLISEQAKADYFEAAAKGRDAKLVSNWVTNEVSARLAAECSHLVSITS